MPEATRDAPETKNIGYDQEGPASMYRGRMTRLFTTDYPVLFWLRSVISPGTRIFDLGGHVGVSFYAYEKYLPGLNEVEWMVCDVPAVTDAGQSLAKEKNTKNLWFTNEFKKLDGYDVVIASGSLQYIETDLAELLTNAEKRPRHLILNLLPLHKQYSFVTLQNIGTAFCPYRIFQFETFELSMKNAGYKMIDKWENPGKSCHIPFNEEYSVETYSGYFFSLDFPPSAGK